MAQVDKQLEDMQLKDPVFTNEEKMAMVEAVDAAANNAWLHLKDLNTLSGATIENYEHAIRKVKTLNNILNRMCDAEWHL